MAPLFLVADVAISACASTRLGRPLGALVASVAALLTAPRRVARLFTVGALGLVGLAQITARRYQLPWHSAAIFAPLPVVVAAVAEIFLARREQEESRVDRAGLVAWAVALTTIPVLTATVTVDLPGEPRPATTAYVIALFFLERATLRFGRSSFGSVVAGVAVAAGCVVVDGARPALRRFDAQVTPFSLLGRRIIGWVADRDGDGIASTGGLDCRDDAREISPIAMDVPDDGVDQNCSGSDATMAAALARFAPGGVHAPTPPRAPTRASVVFVTLDAWRVDVFDDATFPATRAWAAGCTTFTQARATSTYTGPSMVSLHMGVFPRHVYARDGSVTIEPADILAGRMSKPPTLAAGLTLRSRYWTSVVFPPYSGGDLSFLTGYAVSRVLPTTDGTAQYPDASTMIAFARQAKEEANPGLPLLLRLHLMDLHTPYAKGAGRDGYRASARAVDVPLATFLRSLPKDTVVVLTGDHGEGFGEHGYTQHGRTMFDEELRVPLVVCAPGRRPGRVDLPVSLVDVVPTLLDLTGVDLPYPRHGESLVPLMEGETQRRRPWVYAENVRLGQRALVLGCDKWIEDARAGYRALFDVCRDPDERRDVAAEAPDKVLRMRALLGEVVDLDLDAMRAASLGASP